MNEIPKYKNGSKAIPKDEIVVPYSAHIRALAEQKKELINEIKEEMEDVWNNDADRKSDWWRGFAFALDSVTVLLNKLNHHD